MIRTRMQVESKYPMQLAFLLRQMTQPGKFDEALVRIESDDVPAVERAVFNITGYKVRLAYRPMLECWFIDTVEPSTLDKLTGDLSAFGLALFMVLVLVLTR